MPSRDPSHVKVMPRRHLGPLDVPAIGYGAMVLSPGMYGAVDDQSAIRALHHAFEQGATFVDTSDGYGHDFHNEMLLGQGLRGCRDHVVVATKFGFRFPPGAEPHRIPIGYSNGHLQVNTEPRYIRTYALGSLRRLNIERIDLYYPHFPDPEVPIEDVVGALAELVAEGLVAHVGLSNVTAEQVRRALTVHPIAAVQLEWSMWAPGDPDLIALAGARGVGMVAWGPLGGGFLTGSINQVTGDDYRHHFPRFEPGNLQVNNDRYAPIRQLARRRGVSPGQLALAWLLHQHPSVVPIPGSRRPEHIDENLAAAWIELSDADLAELEGVRHAFRPAGRTIFETEAAR